MQELYGQPVRVDIYIIPHFTSLIYIISRIFYITAQYLVIVKRNKNKTFCRFCHSKTVSKRSQACPKTSGNTSGQPRTEVLFLSYLPHKSLYHGLSTFTQVTFVDVHDAQSFTFEIVVCLWNIGFVDTGCATHFVPLGNTRTAMWAPLWHSAWQHPLSIRCPSTDLFPI